MHSVQVNVHQIQCFFMNASSMYGGTIIFYSLKLPFPIPMGDQFCVPGCTLAPPYALLTPNNGLLRTEVITHYFMTGQTIELYIPGRSKRPPIIIHSQCNNRTHNIGYYDNLTNRPRTTTGLLTPHKHTDPAVKVR